jgi:hypothetical protein
MKYGNPRPAGYTGSEYQAAHCGVAAFFENGTSASGELNYTPGINWTSDMLSACGEMRIYRYYLNGANDPVPLEISSHSIAAGLYHLTVGQTVVREQSFGVYLTNCGRLMYGDAYPPSSSTLQIRLADSTRADGILVRRWTIESRGSHVAICGGPNRRNVFVPTGTSYYLPFHMTIVEVPYPHPTYP